MLHVTPEGYSWPTSQGRPFPEGHEFVVVDDFTPSAAAREHANHRVEQFEVLAYARDSLGFNDVIQFTANYSDGVKVFRYGMGLIGPRWQELAAQAPASPAAKVRRAES